MPRPLAPVDMNQARELGARRRALGLSQHALARAVSLTEAILCRAETGRTGMPPWRYEALDRELTRREREREVMAS